MERNTVRSSLLKSVGYDPATKTLEIEFHDGDVYSYRDFPEFLHRGLILAPSKGKFFNGRIAGRFSYERLT